MKIKKIISCAISVVLFMLYTSTWAYAEADKSDFDVYVDVFGRAPESGVWYATDYVFWANVSNGYTYGKGYIPVLWVGSENSLCAYSTEQLRLPVKPSYLSLNDTIPATEGITVDSRYPINLEFRGGAFATPEAKSKNFTGLEIGYNAEAGYDVGDLVVEIYVGNGYILWVGDNIPEFSTKGYISQLELEIFKSRESDYGLTVGDIDGDGDISIEDAQLLLQYYTESKVARLTDKPIKDWYTEKYGSK